MLGSHADVMPLSLLDALNVGEWDRMVDVTFKDVLYRVAAALPVFHSQGRGHVVHATSRGWLTEPNRLRLPLEGQRAGGPREDQRGSADEARRWTVTSACSRGFCAEPRPHITRVYRAIISSCVSTGPVPPVWSRSISPIVGSSVRSR